MYSYMYASYTKKKSKTFLPPKNNIYPLEGDVALGMQDLDFVCFHSMCISRCNPANLWPIRGPAQLPLEPAAHTEYLQGFKCILVQTPEVVSTQTPQHHGLLLLQHQTGWLLLCICPNNISFCFALKKHVPDQMKIMTTH